MNCGGSFYSQRSPLKPGQVHKVAQDVPKLVTIQRCLAPTARLCVVFADEAAAAILRGAGWLAAAAWA